MVEEKKQKQTQWLRSQPECSPCLALQSHVVFSSNVILRMQLGRSVRWGMALDCF